MTVQPSEHPIPRDPDVPVPPCSHPVRDSSDGCCAVCGQPLPPERRIDT